MRLEVTITSTNGQIEPPRQTRVYPPSTHVGQRGRGPNINS